MLGRSSPSGRALRAKLRPNMIKLLCEDGLAGESRGGAEFFFDAQQLVVFRDAIGARS